MADQIASMVVAVNSTSAKEAAADLDRLAASGERAGGVAERSFSRITQASNAALKRWSGGLKEIQALSASSAEGSAVAFDVAAEKIKTASTKTLMSWNRALGAIRADAAQTASAMVAANETVAISDRQIVQSKMNIIRMMEGQRAAAGASSFAAAASAGGRQTSGTDYAALNRHLEDMRDREYHAALGAQRLAQAHAAGAKAAEGATKAVKGHSHELGQMNFMSGQAVREYAVLVNELQRGDMTRFQGSLMTLANRVNATPLLFSKMGVAIGSVIAVLGAFAVAATKGSLEQHDFNKAMALTGDYAHTTYDEMMNLADGIANSANSLGASREALMAVASSGRFLRDELGQVAKSVVEMSRLSGQSAQEIVKEFAKIKDDPLRAVNELDKTMHFLDITTRDAIRTAQEHGHILQATELAINAVTNATAEYSDKADRDIGFVVDRWRALKNTISEVWQKMLDFGKAETLATQIADAKLEVSRAKINERAAMGAAGENGQGGGAAYFKNLMQADFMAVISGDAVKYGDAVTEAEKALAALQKRQADTTASNAQKAAAEAEAAEVKRVTQAIHDRTLQYDRGARREHEIAVTRAQFATARKAFPNDARYSAEAEAQEIDALTRRYKDFKDARVALTDAQREAKRVQAEHNAQLKSMSLDIAQHRAVVDGQAQSEEKLTETQRWAASVIAKLESEYNRLTAAEEKEIRAQLASIVAKDKANQVAAEHAKMLEWNTKAVEDLDRVQRKSALDASREILRMGRGKEFSEEQSRIEAVRDRVLTERIQLERQYREAKKEGTQEEIDGLARLAAKEQEMLAQERRYMDERKAMQADWRNGARAALEDYQTDAADVAGQTNRMWTNAFQGMEDALLNFVTTGKGGFKSLVASILTDLARIQLKIALSKGLEMIFGGMFGMGGEEGWSGMGGGSNANGNAFHSGQIIPFARGGIVNRTTMFPMGMMGEAGPEAIIPLSRGPGGKLGVADHGGGRGGGDINIEVNVNVASDGSSTTDVKGAGQSARELGELVGVKVKETMIQEMKQGGLLWGMANG